MEQKKKAALTRQKILDAAEMEFTEKGPDAARVDRIPRLAGVNKQLIYAHFGSKEGLYTAGLEAVYGRLSSCEETLMKTDFDGPEAVRRIILDYFGFLMENPSFVRLVLWENLNGARHVPETSPKLIRGAEQLLRRGVSQGVLREDLDIEQTVLSLNMFCFSAFSNVHTLSRLLGRDLAAQQEMARRSAHIADVLTAYVQKREEIPT